MIFGRKSSIQNRFVKTIAALFFSFFILLIVGTYVLELFRTSAFVKNDLRVNAENKIEKIELRLSYIIQSLEAFATSSLAINSLIDTAGRTSYLPNAIDDLARIKEVKTLIMFDFAGKPIQSNISGRPDWFNLDNIRPAISISKKNLIFNKISNSMLIVIPISYYDTPQGGIVAEIDLIDILNQDLDNNLYQYHFTINNDWQYTNREIEPDTITAHARPLTESLLYPFNFELHLSQTRKSAMNPVTSTLFEMLFIGLAGIFVTVIFAAQAGKRLAQPIITLTERVRMDIHPCGPVGTDDELEILASTFDENTKNLLTAKNELESRVQVRTAQLEEKTQQLQLQHEKLEKVNRSLNQANSELKYLDKLKDEFISTVSHELRTPLTSIHGTLGLIHGGAVDGDQTKSRELIKIAMQNSERLSQLISDLLDMQKFAANKFDLKLDHISVNELIQNAISGSQGYAQGYSITLNYLAKAGDDYNLMADAHRLRQVMDNLISNAIKYSPQAGHVDIFTEHRAGKIRICVRDYGEGIPEQYQTIIFEKFTQVDSTDQRARSGTGPGLSICKDIISAHHGQIGFENMPDGGALFWFELELVEQTEKDLQL